MTHFKNSGVSGASGACFGINTKLGEKKKEGERGEKEIISENVESRATRATHATGLRGRLQMLPPVGLPDPLPEAAPLSPSLAELDRFFSVAVPHVFPDDVEGWIDPAFKNIMGDYPYE